MYQIDQSTNTNRLAATRAEHKVVAALIMLVACLMFDRISTSLVVLIVVGGLVMGVARVNVRLWVRITSAELFFLLLSVGSVVIVISPAALPQGVGMGFGGNWIGMTPESTQTAARMITRTLAAVSCLSLIALTTPLHDLVLLSRRLRLPALLIDLVLLTYRFLWVTTVMLEQMQAAQAARLGNATWRTALRSAGITAARLFIRSYQRIGRLSDAWAARNFEGDMPRLEQHGREHAPMLLLVSLFAVLAMSVLRWLGVS